MLPIGLALVDRDGRFLTMNKAFRRRRDQGPDMPTYPGDLVVKEDKAAVADAVRRNARGPAMSGDSADPPQAPAGEPVALTVAGLRGLGDAAVLLLLKDNSEEAKLKRQVAQATKMQAVGQLAGGVAHDFNNILTAIIGHCDLMLMRHTPGDSDYDDIQQIKSNSNRAAGLTRQLARLLAPADAAPAGAPASRRRVGSVASAEAAARRDRPAGRQARPRPRPGPRRSGPARAGHRQPRGQCPRRDGRRRAAAR
jgi:signal transduction histidine kinase